MALPVAHGLAVEHPDGDEVADVADPHPVQPRDEHLVVQDDGEAVQGAQMRPRPLVDAPQPAELRHPSRHEPPERIRCRQAPCREGHPDHRASRVQK